MVVVGNLELNVLKDMAATTKKQTPVYKGINHQPQSHPSPSTRNPTAAIVYTS